MNGIEVSSHPRPASFLSLEGNHVNVPPLSLTPRIAALLLLAECKILLLFHLVDIKLALVEETTMQTPLLLLS